MVGGVKTLLSIKCTSSNKHIPPYPESNKRVRLLTRLYGMVTTVYGVDNVC